MPHGHELNKCGRFRKTQYINTYDQRINLAGAQPAMNRQADIQISLTLIISFFIHLVLLAGFVAPRLDDLWGNAKMLKEMFGDSAASRDIIVNINQDDRRVVTPETLLSDRDSAAKGFITKKAGNRWLNNSLDFRALKGSRAQQGRGDTAASSGAGRDRVMQSDDSEMTAVIERNDAAGGQAGNYGIFDETLIPDKNDVTRENALFYSSDGRFSFNTAKFKDFKYFMDMKSKIASNWYPPLMANAVMHGYNPLSGAYTPGSTRIMAIPSQEVKTVFVLNRKGDIIHIQILDSLGQKPLNASCYDAIRLSKSFGPVPRDLLKGDVLVIPFIFGYYVY